MEQRVIILYHLIVSCRYYVKVNTKQQRGKGGATLLKRCATDENCRSSREDSSSLVSSSSSEPM